MGQRKQTTRGPLEEKPRRRRRLAAAFASSVLAAFESSAHEQPASEQPAHEQPVHEQSAHEQSASECVKRPRASTKATPGKPRRPKKPPALQKQHPTAAETAAHKALVDRWKADTKDYEAQLRQHKARKVALAEKRRASQPSPSHWNCGGCTFLQSSVAMVSVCREVMSGGRERVS